MDDSGVVFCVQSTAVIPTHLLTYRVARPSNSEQTKGPANTPAAQSGEAIAAQTASSGGSGQPNSFTASPSMATGMSPFLIIEYTSVTSYRRSYRRSVRWGSQSRSRRHSSSRYVDSTLLIRKRAQQREPSRFWQSANSGGSRLNRTKMIPTT